MERKALERLVSALLEDEHAATRAEAVEDALYMAHVALWGEDSFEETDLKENLNALSVQLMVNKLSSEGLSLTRAIVDMTNEDDEEETAQIIATTNPIVAAIIDHTVDQCLKPSEPFDVN